MSTIVFPKAQLDVSINAQAAKSPNLPQRRKKGNSHTKVLFPEKTFHVHLWEGLSVSISQTLNYSKLK